ncbi:ectoine/hydroxyectoine ABC transporter permease subunit EhuC [Actinomycetes bacterium]|nr:ectoine/hydroxyectoine ABC transporter permease subunit EhuC [Actinomycetes bacterium]
MEFFNLIHTDIILDALPTISIGLLITLLITFLCGVFSLTLGVLVAFGRKSKSRVLRLSLGAYVQVFRSTPFLLQLVYIYFVLPFFGIQIPPLPAGILALTLHYTAYLCEVYRGAIEAVPKGQTDAARALGMRNRVVMARVILPQAIRTIIPALCNYMVSLLKDTSLLSVVTVQEMMFRGQIYAAETYDYFTIYTLVFLIYFAIGFPGVKLVDYLENRMKKGYASRSVITSATETPTAKGGNN